MSTKIKKRSNLDSITYLTTVKTEYEKQLANILVKPLYKMLNSIYSECKRHCEKHKKRDIMKQFQNYLSKVSSWDKESKVYYTNKIVTDSACLYLDKLVSAVFISSTKLLSATASRKKYDVNVVIPDTNIFLYKVLRNASRQCYTNPYLFCDYDITPWDRQRNLHDALILIEDEIKNTIRHSLPFDEILDSYLAQLDEDSDDEEEDDDTKSLCSDAGSLLGEEQISIEDLDEDEEDDEDNASEHSEHSESQSQLDDVINEEMLEGPMEDDGDLSDKMSDTGSEIIILEDMKDDGDERFMFMPLVEKQEKKSYEEILKEESGKNSDSDSEKNVKVNGKKLDGPTGKKLNVTKTETNAVLFDDDDVEDEL